MLPKLFIHVKFISRISREVLTCYISNLESIGSVVLSYRPPKQPTSYVPCPYWNSTHTPGRKIVMFRNFETAISPQPLNEIYRTKTKSYLEASFIIMCSKETVRNDLKFWCNMPNIILTIIYNVIIILLWYGQSLVYSTQYML